MHTGEELKGNRPLSKMRGKKRPVGGGDSPAPPLNPRLSQQVRINPEENMGEELKGNRPLSKMRGNKRPVGGGTRLPCHLTHV